VQFCIDTIYIIMGALEYYQPAPLLFSLCTEQDAGKLTRGSGFFFFIFYYLCRRVLCCCSHINSHFPHHWAAATTMPAISHPALHVWAGWWGKAGKIGRKPRGKWHERRHSGSSRSMRNRRSKLTHNFAA